MTNEQFQQWLKVQERQIAALERIAQALEAIKPERPAPNYKQSLKNFPSFDWASIDAEVEKADRYGAAVVVWGNKSSCGDLLRMPMVRTSFLPGVPGRMKRARTSTSV